MAMLSPAKILPSGPWMTVLKSCLIFYALVQITASILGKTMGPVDVFAWVWHGIEWLVRYINEAIRGNAPAVDPTSTTVTP